MSNLLSKTLELTEACLNSDVLEYLANRGITEATARSWQLGYLPNQQLLTTLDSNLTDLYTTKILVEKVHYSPLHQYVIFPLYNQYNELIGFSGRPPLSNDEVKARGLKKYWHSVFEKRRFLFGLNRAVVSAREKGYMIIGEGQFDTITAHQAGITNVVSTCGTALTSFHIALLARYVDKVYIVFDNDEPGQRAFQRLASQIKEGITLIPIHLPSNGEKDDIDSFIRKFGRTAFEQILTTPSPTWEIDL